MTVKELIAELQEYDQDMEIIVSSDEEGNSFSSLYTIGQATCFRNGRDIELVHEEDVDDYDSEDLEEVLVIN